MSACPVSSTDHSVSITLEHVVERNPLPSRPALAKRDDIVRLVFRDPVRVRKQAALFRGQFEIG